MGQVNPPGCPAQQGNGIDITCAKFLLEAHDCRSDAGQAITEIFGFFRPAGDDYHDEARLNDALVTAVVHVPAVSVTGCLGHQVKADPSGYLIRKAGNMLRANIANCACAGGFGRWHRESDCAALNEANLLLALEHAID